MSIAPYIVLTLAALGWLLDWRKYNKDRRTGGGYDTDSH